MPQYQGVWTLQDAARLQSTQQWATDPLFDYTTLLLQADNAPNGAQNNTFIDSSSNNFTITRNGNTTQGTFTPYSLQPGAWSNYFDGTGDYLTVPANTAFNFGTGNFTIELYFYRSGIKGNAFHDIIIGNRPGSLVVGQWYLYVGPAIGGTFAFQARTSGGDVTVTGGVCVENSWNHLAVVKNGTSLSLFLNGTSVGSITTSVSIGDSSSILSLAAFNDGTFATIGYISNVRVVKGTAVYTGNFTPSPIPLTAITNTSLLTCQSNRFVDNSTNAFAITVNGNTSVQAFSPFAPQYQYTPSVTGGSGYFDGTGDYLTVPSNDGFEFGSGNFTIEFWAFPITISGETLPVARTFNGAGYSFAAYFASGVVNFLYNNLTQITGTTTLSINTWNHIAYVRNSNTLTIYVNGVSSGSGTISGSITTSARVTSIAAREDGLFPFNGYISNVRIVKGTAVYTANFTPPTAPLTAITNTSLLLNFTNAGIYDGTLKNNLETVGNAQVSTSIVKYGTGSMAFDGSGDYCLMQNTPNLRLASTEAFTVEFWVYANALSSDQHVIHAYGLVSPFPGWAFGFGSGGVANTTLAFYDGTTWRNVGTGFVTGNWYHIAVTSQGASSTGRFFVNGAQQGSSVTFASTITNSVAPIAIGSQSNGSFSFNGYIDDLRITKGIARYTANFTPPTVALPRQ